MSRNVRRIEAVVPRRASTFGGKARGLAELARAGFAVPAAYAVDSAVAEAHLSEALGEPRILGTLLGADRDPSPSALDAIARRVREAPLPSGAAEQIRRAFDALVRDGARAVAVRSSSTREDSGAGSGAGVHLTRLGVVTETALECAVKDCYASLFSERALSYLRNKRVPDAPSMGLVLQAMVPADVAGVLFTVNPLTGDSSEIVVSAAYGLGCSVVDGRVTPDSYRIDKRTRELRDVAVATKATRVVLDEHGGTREEPLAPERAAAPSLDRAACAELLELARALEHRFGAPRDVEWALHDGHLYVLQARPIASLAGAARQRAKRGREGARDRTRIVWSNVNVGEALGGPATPLTWSILSRFSELGFRRAFAALGCSVPKDAELVGNFRGRIYLNLSEILEIASQVPGLDPELLLSLGGGFGSEHLPREHEGRGRAQFYARLPLTVARMVRENVGIVARVPDFDRAFDDERRRFSSIDLRLLSPLALDRTLSDAERLLDETGATMLTCYGRLLVSLVILRVALRRLADDEDGRLERGLLSGLAEVESAAPGLALFHIAEMARTEDAARSALLARDDAARSLAVLPEGPTRRALTTFLDAYGHRGVREAEIAEPRWAEDAAIPLAALRLHLERPPTAETPLAREQGMRRAREIAEAELARRVPLAARFAVRHLLADVQRFMRLRERLRSHVTRVLGMFRAIALDASRRLDRATRPTGPDAAFLLTLDELHAVLRGQLSELGPLLERRRRELERDRALRDPPPSFVGLPPDVDEDAGSGTDLSGLAASEGVAEGRVRVLVDVADAARLQGGEVLVVRHADVGWSPLFVVAAAVVTELGGPLSHAAVVLREYGVPAVVNVPGATRALADGDVVRVDGGRGQVRVLSRSSAPRAVMSAATP